jgi:hypothetical protein
MTNDTLPPRMLQLAADIRFIVEHTRCPEPARKILADWSDEFSCDGQGIHDPDILEGIVDALVTLGHSNASFSRSLAPPFIRGKSALDVRDTGGYFASRNAIATLIRIAPVSDDCRLTLARQVLSRVDRDEQTILRLLPF